MREYSDSSGSLTLTRMSARFQTSAAVPTISAPALLYSSSGMAEPRPAPDWTTTWCRLSTSAFTPPGTRPTRYSLSLISRTLPISMAADYRPLFSRVDLRALQRPAVVDVDALPLGEHVEGLDAGLAVAVARVLGAAEGQVRLRADGGGVDVEDPRVHVAHGREGLVDVLGVDGGRGQRGR